MLNQKQSCDLAESIIEYAIAGKVWIMSCLKEFGQVNSNGVIGVMIGGLFIRKEDLDSLLERLIRLQKASSNKEISDLIGDDMIPMSLLYKEALWKQFQDLIDRWCQSAQDYHPEPIDTSDVIARGVSYTDRENC